MEKRLSLFIFFLMVFCMGTHPALGAPKLHWDPSTGEVTGYKIHYGENSGSYTKQVDVGNQTECALSNLAVNDNTRYYFAVKAYNEAGESDYSNEVSWESGDSTPPLPPQQVQAGNSTLTWQANSEPDLNAYHVYYGTSSRNYGPLIPVGSNTSYTITGIEMDTKYYFAVTAVDTSGNESGYSNEVFYTEPAPPAQEPVPMPVESAYRINVGGPEVTLNGSVWLKDEHFSGGRTYLTSQAISGTTDDSIYQSERWAKDLSYQIPVASGTYTIKLHFAEIYWKDASKRTFNVDIENSQDKFSNYDIVSEVGALTADIKTFENISVADGVLDIRFSSDVDNAKLSAIEVFPHEEVTDIQPPSVVISSPTSSSSFLTKNSQINLSGTASDNIEILSVEWTNSAGGSGTASGTQTWSISDLSLSEGENLIKVEAVDSNGNKGSGELKVTYSPESADTATTTYRINAGGPEVTLDGKIWSKDEHYSGGSVYSKKEAISGTSNDPLYQTERFGKEMKYSLPIEPGIYAVKLHMAEIFWKRKGKRLFTVNIENMQAILESYDIFSNAGALTADVKQFENIAVTDGILDINFTTELDNAKISAIEVLPYEETADTQAPSLIISSPTRDSRYTTKDSQITLSGTASDNMEVVSIAWTNSTGGSGIATGTSTWSIKDLNLTEGENTIAIKATDSAGNQDTQTLIVTLDTRSPSVMFTSPTSSETYVSRNATLNIAGTASDDIQLTKVSWTNAAGGSGSATGISNWSVTEVPLKEGENVLTVSAFDSAGNVGKKSLSISYALEKTALTYRINVGGPEITLGGVTWGKDQYYSGGNLYSNKKSISGTSDEALYQTERYGKTLGYKIPVEPGLYQVKLHFAEIFWNDSGKRIFDAWIEGTQGRLDDHDIYAGSGALAADIQTFDNVTVDDGFLNIELSTEVDNAKLSAIEIIGM